MKKYLWPFLVVVCFCNIHPAFSEEKVDLLILGGTVVTMNEERRVLEEGAIAIDKGVIVGVGPQDEIQRKYTAAQVLNGKGKAILPGLINGHTHLPMSLFRGLADDMNLHDWLMNYIFPAEAKNVNEAFVRAGARLGLAEMFRAGTTTIADMYFFEDAIAEEAAKAGMRGIFGEGILDFPTPDCPTFEEGIQSAKRMMDKWRGHPLIHSALAPHSVYTVSEEHLKKVSELAKETGAPILIHLSETETEVANIQKLHDHSPISYLDRMGFFDTPVIAAHLVFPQAGDLSILKKKEVGVIHNPHSNMKLSSGIAPIPEMLKENIALGLGTDGAASNNNLSLWNEMDAAAKLHKVASKDPTAVKAEDALAMATIGGARALGLENEIGSIEVGKKGDIVLVDLEGIHQIPSYNIYSTLIYASTGSDVHSVIIDGKIVMENRNLLTLDENQIKKETRYYRDLIRNSLKP